MKDYEILMWLMKLDPESNVQRKAIKSAERAFRNAIENDIDEGVEDFLSAYSKNDIINKASGELYEEYLEFCTDSDYVDVSQAMLTKIVKREFNVNVKPVKINGKSTRVFK